MDITITTPTARQEIVTDLDALRQCIDAANRLNDLKDESGRTEAEAAASRRQRDALTVRLRELADRVRESTITLTLHGLKSNEWNQIVLQCTTTEHGQTTKDLPLLLSLSLPAMVDGLTDAHGKPLDMDRDEIQRLAKSLTDTQSLELLQTIQTLNTPASALPKEILTMLGSVD
ncbi:hypothetical protein [Bifidobacterium scardovii]|uniref:Uncharacterized protein n=1 Tax=Bifidobacterium scardovii TaxID=158787 RepID=A0A087DGM8_9BIFI|nr:hypothetical protein [Bifidobacterium scardovii]DAE55497.1 MAG TPA: hypothetical protein [Caudoviricetes sp.]KFI94678.1 hypothetical protein BSCA_0730 [Bifidobacterium scardovii]MDK6349816.1 hypothetical protein [Bifidobacterium scardovii]MDU8982520.1 hypothetical protein [Bifidobacterium scardovii]BAQ32090.1 hypothetical protein BBSC_2010 [Bifidobacterium scardovii JCM 12489 = DSM 13734]